MRVKKSGIFFLALILVLVWTSRALIGSDQIPFLLWWLATAVIGIGFYPITASLFSGFEDKGWLFSKAIGIAVSGFILWVLCSFKLLRFNMLSCVLTTAIVIILILVCSIVLQTGKSKLKNKSVFWKPDINLIIKEEFIFLLLFLVWTYLAGFKPEAHGTEKFMDYGFLAALMRNETIPPPDIWHAPDTINYYYGGQYYTAFLSKLTATKAAETYNLMRSFVAAMLGGMSFSIVYQMLRRVKRDHDKKLHVTFASIGGFFATLSVVFAGNFHYVIYGLIGKWFKLSFAADYWFPNSTRYIGHNPENADKCIHEFPCYSFVLGDLHAHVVNTMFVMVVVGLMLAMYLKVKDRGSEKAIGSSTEKTTDHELSKKYKWKHILWNPYMLLAGLFIGIFQFNNYWDFVIYFTLAMICNFCFQLYTNRDQKKQGVFAFVIQAVEVLVIATLAALPFNLGFDTMFSGVALAKNHTAFYQFMVLWGLPLAISIVFAAAMILLYKRGSIKPGITDGFAVVIAICAIGLILIPELVYIRDIYEDDFARSNTMFKLTYQAFILFGLFTSYALMRMISMHKQIIIKVVSGVLIVAQVATFGYSYNAVKAWFGPIFKPDEYRGLDATRYMINVFPEDYPAVNWLNEEVNGNAVILEANGDSYSDYARITAMTGLQTPLGWYVHEWLWRNDVAELNQRVEDIKTIYTSSSETEVKELLEKYKVDYIYIGKLEYEKFGEDLINGNLLRGLGDVVYGDPLVDNATYIIKLN